MSTRVRVLRAKGLPNNVAVLIRDRPGVVTYHIDEDLITPLGARLLEESLNAITPYWTRATTPAPEPTMIKVAG